MRRDNQDSKHDKNHQPRLNHMSLMSCEKFTNENNDLSDIDCNQERMGRKDNLQAKGKETSFHALTAGSMEALFLQADPTHFSGEQSRNRAVSQEEELADYLSAHQRPSFSIIWIFGKSKFGAIAEPSCDMRRGMFT